ncbi:hypothetical protein M426DRAFT_7087 [Hypoxylon sp. CI-4A]|nr:hypothetical protein M426DRAFT_7087 [Hypoxylon sp. CI-4A]
MKGTDTAVARAEELRSLKEQLREARVAKEEVRVGKEEIRVGKEEVLQERQGRRAAERKEKQAANKTLISDKKLREAEATIRMMGNEIADHEIKEASLEKKIEKQDHLAARRRDAARKARNSGADGMATEQAQEMQKLKNENRKRTRDAELKVDAAELRCSKLETENADLKAKVSELGQRIEVLVLKEDQIRDVITK